MRKQTAKKVKSKAGAEKTTHPLIAELRLLEMLINKFIEKLEKNGFEPKVQDALRAIQLKQKLTQTSEAEKVFWSLIDQLRSQELGSASPKSSGAHSGRKERCDGKKR